MATPATRPAQSEGTAKDAPILKAFYFGLHLHGLLSHAALEHLFKVHPEWKHA